MSTTSIAQGLVVLLRNTNAATLRSSLLQWSLQDVGDALVQLPVADQARVLRILPTRAAVAVFEYLSTPKQRALIPAMSSDDLAVLLNDMAPDDRTLFLSELPTHATHELLTLLSDEERAQAEKLLAFPAESVGRLMTPDYVAIRAHWVTQDALEHIRAHGRDSETLDVLYVVDDHGTLIDDIRVRELLLVPVTTPIADLMNRRFAALRITDDQRAAVQMFRREDRTALPVIDEYGFLIGIVTVDDVLDAAQEMATRDLQRFGALFVPLIISSGGNSGSQASTLVIRALALGEITLRDWWKVARRELVSGLALGGMLGAIGFLRIAGWSLFTNLYGPHWLLVAVTVGVALVGVVLWGALVGSMLPFGLRRLGFDPATSSAPFVATLVDVTGLVIYFSVGVLILRGTLL